MSQAFQYLNDVQGTPSPCLPQSANIQSASLTAASIQPFTVPSNLGFTLFALILTYGPNAEIWVSDGNTASGPVGASFASSTSMLNPPGLQVQAGDVISFKNNGSSSASVCASLYGIR